MLGGGQGHADPGLTSPHHGLERDLAGGTWRDDAGEVPLQLGRADAVLARGEGGALRSPGRALHVLEPGEEAVDDRGGADGRVAHVAVGDREGHGVARLGLGGADALDDGHARPVRGRLDAGHRREAATTSTVLAGPSTSPVITGRLGGLDAVEAEPSPS